MGETLETLEKNSYESINSIKRIFVEKKKPFDIEAESLFLDLKENLGISNLSGVRVVNRYDISGLSDDEYQSVRSTIFSEPPVDFVYDEVLPTSEDEIAFAIKYLPGQYDQRADSAAQCIQMFTLKQKPLISAARIIVLKFIPPFSTQSQEFKPLIDKIKNYLINPVDSMEAPLSKPLTLEMKFPTPDHVEWLNNFIHLTESELDTFRKNHGLAMSLQDLCFCQKYFKEEENRDPSITEIKVLDTYWSDHCRHTTFQTRIKSVEIENSPFTVPVRNAFEKFLATHRAIKSGKTPEIKDNNSLTNDSNTSSQEPTYFITTSDDIDICLMNIATMSMKEMKAKGLLEDMEFSGEVNACSIIREVIVDGKPEEWLIMFKNETHNHPTEIEPFGGAATCLGGAIRDPLSGRAFVYQAMRVTGSANPLHKIEDTLPGKLPQRKITTEAAHGYSSYGNQIGVPTGQVSEIYHEGYVAKRMEVGAVIGAVPRKNVLRLEPQPGDVILLVGGKTGRDGIGGATGSSKEHTEESISTAGAEVQKGNAPEERKLQRLYRNPEVCSLIKKSNDFGAGGVSVAIGELADGLEIFLDRVPKKYEGLDGTELAISESQERMAVVVSKENAPRFIQLALMENLEAVEIANVTSDNRLKMFWRDQTIVNIKRSFIDTHGVRQETDITVTAPNPEKNYFNQLPAPIQKLKDAVQQTLTTLPDEKIKELIPGDFFDSPIHTFDANINTLLRNAWLEILKDFNICSQRGLGECFDGTVGAGTVLMPFGGTYQYTPIEAMSAKIPVLHGETTTASLMSYGFNPEISSWNPFHGAVYSVVEAVAKITASGGDYQTIRTSLQEYFEKLGTDKKRWGKPFSALLGAYYALTELGIAAIGGKDSMSGTFKDLDVPPTLITFAVDTTQAQHVISPEFKAPGSNVVLIKLERDQHEMPLFDLMKKNYSHITQLIKQGKIISAQTVRTGGIAAAISKMTFGNRIGFQFTIEPTLTALFSPLYGSILLEIPHNETIETLLAPLSYTTLGHTISEPLIKLSHKLEIDIETALHAWESTLAPVFPTTPASHMEHASESLPYSEPFTKRNPKRPPVKIAKPRVIIPVFPGSNCEYESMAAFERAGAVAETLVLRNLTPATINQSLEEFSQKINHSQIVMVPGGFSAGDEPDGSGKFIAAVFRNPHVKEAVMNLLKQRDGLMLGICNGFQAFIKLGLVPYGEIRDMDQESPTLTFNQVGHYVSMIVRTQIASVLSPWFIHHNVGDTHLIPSAHGEGRFIASPETMIQLMTNGQIATQYVDPTRNLTMNPLFNPNGSMNAVEGITSPDGRVLGKMGHTERITSHVAKNIPGDKHQRLFESGVDYFG